MSAHTLILGSDPRLGRPKAARCFDGRLHIRAGYEPVAGLSPGTSQNEVPRAITRKAVRDRNPRAAVRGPERRCADRPFTVASLRAVSSFE